jgi:hypothetical protein
MAFFKAKKSAVNNENKLKYMLTIKCILDNIYKFSIALFNFYSIQMYPYKKAKRA